MLDDDHAPWASGGELGGGARLTSAPGNAGRYSTSGGSTGYAPPADVWEKLPLRPVRRFQVRASIARGAIAGSLVEPQRSLERQRHQLTVPVLFARPEEHSSPSVLTGPAESTPVTCPPAWYEGLPLRPGACATSVASSPACVRRHADVGSSSSAVKSLHKGLTVLKPNTGAQAARAQVWCDHDLDIQRIKRVRSTTLPAPKGMRPELRTHWRRTLPGTRT